MRAGEFHGPLSPVGAAIGVVILALPFVVGGFLEGAVWATWVAGPLVGLLLLIVPGRARQLGTGLVVSALTLPLFQLAIEVLGAAT